MFNVSGALTHTEGGTGFVEFQVPPGTRTERILLFDFHKMFLFLVGDVTVTHGK